MDNNNCGDVLNKLINNFISNNQIINDNNEFLCKIITDTNIFGQASYKDCSIDKSNLILKIIDEKTDKYDKIDLKTISDLSFPTQIKNVKFPKFDFKMQIKLNKRNEKEITLIGDFLNLQKTYNACKEFILKINNLVEATMKGDENCFMFDIQ